MKIKEFLDENFMPIAVLCKMADVCPYTIRKAIYGESISYSSATKIVNATKGKVTLQELPLAASRVRASHRKMDHADNAT